MIVKNRKTIIGLLCSTPILFLLSSANASEPNRQPWIAIASSFIEADRLFRLNAQSACGLKYLKKRKECEQALMRSELPSTERLLTLLQSESHQKQSIACATIYITGIHSPKIVKTIVDIFTNTTNSQLKHFSLLALKKISLEDLTPFENALFKEINDEEDSTLLAEEILFLMKFPPKKRAAIATTLLFERTDPGIKKLAYGVLHDLGPEYTAPVLEELNRRGDEETLSLLKDIR